MRAPSPLRQLALLGAVALAGFLVLALHAGVAEAGPGASPRARLAAGIVRTDTDTVATARPAPLPLDTAAADTAAADPRPAARPAARPDTALAGDTLRAATPADSAAAPADVRVDMEAMPLLTAGAARDTALFARLPGTADTVRTDTTRRALDYLPGVLETGTAAAVAPRRFPGLRGALGTYWQRNVTLDSTAYEYTVRESVGGEDVRAPAVLTLEQFVAAQRRAQVTTGFRALAAQRAANGRRRSGVGITVEIPGGQQSAFRTLFGKNEVDLTVNGRSNVDLGLTRSQSDLRAATTTTGASLAPDFAQQLNLNVAGTIGDKLRINVNYDTESQFTFENQVSLVYTGYADDIVQRIEAGNVFLQTPSELIQGGQRLFGVRTDLRFGPLALTAVASQQDAESSEVVIEGGAQETPFSIPPTEYEDNTHFFVAFAFHNTWDGAHAIPTQIVRPPNFDEIIDIEVFKHDQSLNNVNTTGDDIITAQALADLAEPGGSAATPAGRLAVPNVLPGGEAYLAQFAAQGLDPFRDAILPDPTRDVYSDNDLTRIRQNEQIDVEREFALPAGGANSGRFRRLTQGVDYTFDRNLGWLSLTTALQENDYLAVAYQYRTLDGRVVTVGDYGQATAANQTRTILKLLRARVSQPESPLWDLTMRNVYRIGGRSLNPTSFTLGLTYEAPGSAPDPTLPTVSFGNNLTLLQALGLDRHNIQGQPTPDNLFDFDAGLTIDVQNGRVIFPVRQPFGDYLVGLITRGQAVGGGRVDVSVTEGTPADAAARFAFPQLYNVLAVNARQQFPQFSRYRLAGAFRSASQSVFNVGFGLVEGTVRVTSGGQQLQENRDFRVNYPAGTVEIIDPRLLQSGQQVRVQVEQNRLFAVGSKTLLGLRADYRLAENTTFGATWMRLSERALVDKFNVGEEGIDNTIFGLDGRYLAEPRWITRALDALPFIQTRAPSRVELRGEVAQLNPGHPQTLAFDQTVRRLNGPFDLPEDELRGLSSIDDFEGSENAYSQLADAGGWRLAALPNGAGPAGSRLPGSEVTTTAQISDPAYATNWRGLFGWYTITNEVYNSFRSKGLLTAASSPVTLRNLFPDRFAGGQGANNRDANTPISLLDLYFDPRERGPYNYNDDLAGVYANNPRDAWGGMIRSIDGSYSNFNGQNNVEFIEMIVAVAGGPVGTDAVSPGARLVLDLGRMNEDVIPDRITSTEDGLRDTYNAADLTPYGRRPGPNINSSVDIFPESGRTEDLGLDGLPSDANDVGPGGTPYNAALSEKTFFSAFLGSNLPASQSARILDDPSGDDFHNFLETGYFDNTDFFPRGATVQERYAHYFPAYELNSFQAQNEIQISGSEGKGISSLPNTEDVDGDSEANLTDSYHRYTIPLDDAGIRASPFFQNPIDITEGASAGQTYYLIRIPVRTENQTVVGVPQDNFSAINEARVWVTGADAPLTIRIASFQLVGSKWLQSERVGTVLETGDGPPPPGPDPNLFVATVNNEESPKTYARPRQAIYRETAVNTGTGSGGGLAREQALVLRAETLADGRTAALQRSYTTRPLDLTRYDRLRMYVHGHGFEPSDSMRVVVRIGDDETQNYYEYEQPIYPFSLDDAAAISVPLQRADSLWQTVTAQRPDRNSVDVPLSAFNRLKVARDGSGAPLDAVFPRPEDAPVHPDGSPRGARISLRGQPSIQDVRTVVLGVRNGIGGRVTPLDTVEVWFNELRATGYDEASGASGFLNATFVFADVGGVTARFSQTQDGFGGLEGGLGAREFSNRTALSVQSSFNAHRLLPARFGWSIPVSYSLTANDATPRYDPRRGDIRVSELVDAANAVEASGTPPAGAAPSLTAAQIVERAQTVTGTRNFRVQVSKTGSRSPWLRYTLDGLTAAYSQTAQIARDPSFQFNDANSWTANAGYRVAVPRPKTVRPLWFTSGVPILGTLASLRLNVLPQTFSFSTDARRNMSQVRSRLLTSAFARPEPDTVQAFRSRTRRTQVFDHSRQTDVQYNPFPFLQVSYGSNTAQDLGAAGQNEAFRILVRNRADTTGAFQTFSLDPDLARVPGSDVYRVFGIKTAQGYADSLEVLGGRELDVVPVGQVLSGILSGDRSVRTSAYSQSLTAALRLSTQRVRWLAWIRPQPLSYQTTYQWNDVPIATRPDLSVSGAGTRVQLQTGLQLVPTDFWRLFPFYRRLEASAGRGPGLGAAVRRPGAAPPARDGQAEARPDSSAGRRGFNPLAIPRSIFLAATGISDVTVNYRGAFTSSAGGLLGDSYSLLSGITGAAPSIGYRLGLVRTLPIERRLADGSTSYQYADNLDNRHAFDARTTVEPFRALRIGLSWQTSFSDATRQPYQYLADATATDGFRVTAQPANTSGTGESTIIALGGSYQALRDRHLQRFRDDTAGGVPDGGAYASEFLLRPGLAADFQSEFARGLGSFGPRGLFQIPLPGWDITYSGLNRLPIIRSLTQQVTLRHNYSATSRSDYGTFIATTNQARAIDLGGNTFVNLVAPGAVGVGAAEANVVTVNERFQPLIGASIGLKGGIQADVTWNRSNLYTLQTTSNQITEKNIQDVQVQLSYAKTGLRLLGLRRLNNNLRLSMSASYGTDQTYLRNLRTDLETLLRGGTPEDLPPIAQRRLQVFPRVSYTISNQVTADVFVRYETSKPTGGPNAFGTSKFDGGVSIRILFSN